MYLSLGQAAREVGVAKSTISKALSSGKLSYRKKNSDGYKIDPAELFRVYPKTTKTDADELSRTIGNRVKPTRKPYPIRRNSNLSSPDQRI